MKRIVLLMLTCLTLLGCSMFKSQDYTPKEWVKNNYEVLVLAESYSIDVGQLSRNWKLLERLGKSPNMGSALLCEDMDVLIKMINTDKQNKSDTIELQKGIMAHLENQKKRILEFSEKVDTHNSELEGISFESVLDRVEFSRIYDEREISEVRTKLVKDAVNECHTRELRKKYR